MSIYSLQQLRETAPAEFQGLSDAQLIVEYSNSVGQNPQDIAEQLGYSTGRDRGELAAGISSGVDVVQMLGTSAAAGIADIVGAEDTSEYLRGQAERQGYESYLAGKPGLDRVEDLEGVGDYIDYAQYQIGKQLPIMGTVVAAQALPGLGQAGTAAGLTRLAATAPRALGGGGVQQGASFAARKQALAQGEALAKSTMVGTGLGFGSLYESSAADGDPDPWKALLGAVPYGLAEAAVPAALTGVARLKTGGYTGGAVSRFGKAGAVGSVTEAATEVAQTGMEFGIDGTATAEEMRSGFLNAAVAGGLTGGSMSGAVSAIGQRRIDAPKKVETNVLGETDLAGNAPTPVQERQPEFQQNLDLNDPLAGQYDEAGAPQNIGSIEQPAEQAEQAPVLDEDQFSFDFATGPQQNFAASLKAIVAKFGNIKRGQKKVLAQRLEMLQRTRAGVQADNLFQQEKTKPSKRRAKKLRAAMAQNKAEKIRVLDEQIADTAEQVNGAAEAAVAREKLADFKNALKVISVNDKGEATLTGEITERQLAALQEGDPNVYEQVAPKEAAVEVQDETDLTVSNEAEAEIQGDLFEDVAVAPVEETQASPLAQETNTAPVEEVVQTQDQIDSEMSAAEQAELEAIVVTEQDSAVMDVEIRNILKSEVDSTTGEATGAPTLADGVHKAIAIMLRHPALYPAPRIGNAGKSATDPEYVNKEATAANSEQMKGIHKMLLDVVKYATIANNQAGNLDKRVTSTVGGVTTTSKQRKAAGEVPQAKYNKAIRDLEATFKKLLNPSAGGMSDKDLSAILGALKVDQETNAKTSIKEAPMRKKISAIFTPGYNFVSAGKVNTSIDSLISTAFSQYKDGTLGQKDVVSGTVTRGNKAEMKKGMPTPLEATVAEAKEDGKDVLSAVLERVSSWKGKPSPYAVTLGRSIRDVLERMNEGKAPVQVEFVGVDNDVTGPQFDPNTNTVYLNRDASQEQVLHEALHSVLQGYVFNNPTEASVVDLQNSVDNIIAFSKTQAFQDVAMPQDHKDKALVVIGKLEQLRNEGNPLDAALELISYGSTLRDFRQLIAEIDPSPSAATQPWFEQLTAAFKTIIRLVQTFLTGKGEAERVVLNSLSLLEKARTTDNLADIRPVGGAKLFMSEFNDVATLDSAGKPVGDLFSSTKAKDGLYDAFTSRFLFGKNWPARAEAIANSIEARKEIIAKKLPKVAAYMSKWAAHFQIPESLTTYFKTYKEQRNTIYMNLERLVRSIEKGDTATQQAIFSYLDGDATAFDGMANGDRLKTEADIVRDTMNNMIKGLPQSIQDEFAGKDFTKKLIYVSDQSTISSHAMTMTALGRQLSKQGISLDVELVENIDLLMTDANGDVVLDGETFYKATVTPTDGTIGYATMVSKTKYDLQDGQMSTAATQVNVSVQEGEYSMKKYDGSSGNYRFTQDNNYKDNLDARKVSAITNAMRNTVGGVASFYATQNFMKAMAIQGKESGQVFDTVEDILAAYPEFAGKIGTGDGQSLPASVAQASQLGDKIRLRGQFVQYPQDIEQYGDMAGKIVHGPVFAAMHDMSDRNPLVNVEGYNQALRAFKKSKTIYNPGTHVTNIASNVSLLMLHDIPLKTLGKAASLMARYETGKGKPLTPDELAMMKVFMSSGAMLGNYSSVEVKRELAENAENNLLIDGNESAMTRVTAFINFEAEKGNMAARLTRKLGKKLVDTDDVATQLYAAEDNAFRLASFIKHVGDSKSLSTDGVVTDEMLQAAGRRARTDFLDYDIDSKSVKAARQSWLPFVSWTYAITPVLGRIVLHQPWKVVNLLAGYAMIDMAASALAGDDEEERRRGPAKLDENVFGIPGLRAYIRLPFGDDNNPVYYKLGDYIPLASTVKGLPTNNGFAGQDWWPQGLQPGGPFITAILASIGGVDAFTGEKLHDETDGSFDKAMNVGEQLLNVATPPWLRTSNIEKSIDAIQGTTNFAGRKQDVARLIVGNILGLKIDGYNVEQEMLSRSYKDSQLTRDFGAAMNRIKREETRSGNPDYEGMNAAMQELQADLYDKLNELYKLEE